ncbi:histidine kinase [Nostocales cyanobacterium HT-58-2]|nr:histidine kinase [Nostocales cyanobacterium HT-58-2]
MLRRLKLASQFTLLLSLIFIGGIVLSGFGLSKALEQKAQAEISYRGQMVMQMVNSVISYTSDRITPLLSTTAEPNTHFIPETIPSFAARQVFEVLKQNWKYKDFVYKDATLNPTNLADKADLFEAKLVERFQSDRTLKTLSGFRKLSGEQLFYTAQPLVMTKPNCLKCHSTPDVAPKTHINQYGTQNGYGWKLNSVIGTQIVYIPASEVFMNARRSLSLFISIFIGIFALVILVINYLLKRRVIQPLKPMAQLAQKMSLDTVSITELEALERTGLEKIVQRSDELGQLGRVFQKMVREVCEREEQLSKQLQQLQVEVDSSKLVRQVAEIAETDYFQKLQQTAKEIRNQWSQPRTEGD